MPSDVLSTCGGVDGAEVDATFSGDDELQLETAKAMTPKRPDHDSMVRRAHMSMTLGACRTGLLEGAKPRLENLRPVSQVHLIGLATNNRTSRCWRL